jgi:hypothetical protein
VEQDLTPEDYHDGANDDEPEATTGRRPGSRHQILPFTGLSLFAIGATLLEIPRADTSGCQGVSMRRPVNWMENYNPEQSTTDESQQAA